MLVSIWWAIASILRVDENPEFRRLAQRLLADFDLVVTGEAGTAASALVAAEALVPDAVLVDVGLPDGDGISLACRLTDLPWKPRVLLTSSDAKAADAGDVLDSGAAGFVPKDLLPDVALHDLLVGDRR